MLIGYTKLEVPPSIEIHIHLSMYMLRSTLVSNMVLHSVDHTLSSHPSRLRTIMAKVCRMLHAIEYGPDLVSGKGPASN